MADKVDPDLIGIWPLSVQKISLSLPAVSEICAFKVADLTHGSNPRAVTGTRAHDCALLFDEHPTDFSGDRLAGHRNCPYHTYKSTL
jgi:hypothetical protein